MRLEKAEVPPAPAPPSTRLTRLSWLERLFAPAPPQSYNATPPPPPPPKTAPMMVDQLPVTKLSLSPGDVLAVMVPTTLSGEQRAAVAAHLSDRLPLGVKAMVFDGGITIAHITAGGKG